MRHLDPLNLLNFAYEKDQSGGISPKQDAECLIKDRETRLDANYPRIQWSQFQTG